MKLGKPFLQLLAILTAVTIGGLYVYEQAGGEQVQVWLAQTWFRYGPADDGQGGPENQVTPKSAQPSRYVPAPSPATTTQPSIAPGQATDLPTETSKQDSRILMPGSKSAKVRLFNGEAPNGGLDKVAENAIGNSERPVVLDPANRETSRTFTPQDHGSIDLSQSWFSEESGERTFFHGSKGFPGPTGTNLFEELTEENARREAAAHAAAAEKPNTANEPEVKTPSDQDDMFVGGSKSFVVFDNEPPVAVPTPAEDAPQQASAPTRREFVGGSKAALVFDRDQSSYSPPPPPQPITPTEDGSTTERAFFGGSKSDTFTMSTGAGSEEPPAANVATEDHNSAVAPPPATDTNNKTNTRTRTVLWALLAAGLSFLFLCAVFRPLEWAFPAKSQRFFRPAWWTDLCFFLGQYLLWSGLVLFVLSFFADWVDRVAPVGFRQAVAAQPWYLQAIEVVLLSDLLIYWGHRLQHRVGFLWRFHSIHHSAEHLDFLAAHREHPLDTVYTMGLINLPMILLGFPIATLAGLIAFRGLWAIYIHSNVRLPIGPLRVLLGAPELHHWHHDLDRDAGNYANLSPLMDVLFGTYRCPDHEPEQFGIREPIARSYWGQMLHPFRSGARQDESDHRPTQQAANAAKGPGNI